MSRIVVKLGGAQLAPGAPLLATAAALSGARAAGHEVVVVHGGGGAIRELAGRLGLAERKVDGLRVTDAETARVVLAVLAGTQGKTLAAALVAAGVPAVSLCGADAGMLAVRPSHAGELGYVGEVCAVDVALLEDLLATGRMPLVAPVAPLAGDEQGPDEELYNVNADAAAAPLASALGAQALLLMTDVNGVLDDGGQRVQELDPDGAELLQRSGAVGAGMRPKLAAALSAADHMPDGLVCIAPAGSEHSILDALAGRTGTRVLCSGNRKGDVVPHG